MDALPSGLPERVADEEPLARFLTSSSQFNSSSVKPGAFIPQVGSVRVSVYRHGSMPDGALWELAARHIESGGRRVHGVAIASASVVRAAHVSTSVDGSALPALDVEADDTPPMHANIVGWARADEDAVEPKAANKALAMAIATRAELIRR